MRETAIIYGIGNKALENLKEIENEYSVVAVSDSDSRKWGGVWQQYPVIRPSEIDKVLVRK